MYRDKRSSDAPLLPWLTALSALLAIGVSIPFVIRAAKSSDAGAAAKLGDRAQRLGLSLPPPDDWAILVQRAALERRVVLFAQPAVNGLLAATFGSLAVPFATDSDLPSVAGLFLATAMATQALAIGVAPALSRWLLRTRQAFVTLRSRRLRDYWTPPAVVSQALTALTLLLAFVATFGRTGAEMTLGITIVGVGMVTFVVTLVAQQQQVRAPSGVGSPEGLLWDEFERRRAVLQTGWTSTMSLLAVTGAIGLTPLHGWAQWLHRTALLLAVAAFLVATVLSVKDTQDPALLAGTRRLLGRPADATPEARS